MISKDQLIFYTSFVVDVDFGLVEIDKNQLPANTRFVGWQCGFEPLFVAVVDSFNHHIDGVVAEEVATEYLVKRGWFVDGPTDPDYVI